MPRRTKAFVIVYVLIILALTTPAMLIMTLMVNTGLDSSKKLQALAEKANTTATQRAIDHKSVTDSNL